MHLPKSPFSFIAHFVFQQRLKFAGFVLISILFALNEAAFPYFLKEIVNALQSYVGDRTQIYTALKTILIPLILLRVASEMGQRTQGILQLYTFPHFRAHIRQAVFQYVKEHSQDYFANHFAGNLAKKLADLPTSCQTIMEIICFQLVTATACALIIFVLMWLTLPLFACILLVWFGIHFGVTLLFLRHAHQLWMLHAESVAALSGSVVDAFNNIANIRLFARGDYESNYLKIVQKKEIARAEKALWSIEIMRIILGLNGLCLILGMLFSLLYGWMHHFVSLGDFTQIGMQSAGILGWAWFVTYQMIIFSREMGTIGNALTLIQREHDLVDKINAKPIVISSGKIDFSHVCFGYQPDRWVFNDLNITIAAGEKIGLVGFSGSGKSTFVNLILRFYDVSSGHILIDDQVLADVTQHSLRAQIAMIPQEPTLFHRSLMENIRYGRLDASDEAVILAAKQAHCHEFIEMLPEGYQSLVGERGIKLSGGQRQRIAIARAILKNAPILILDEATASLDSVTETLIQDSLHHLMAGRTTIVVAHRLSTLADMDRILVFDQGRILEQGTKNSLLAANGHFALLWKKQSDGFLP